MFDANTLDLFTTGLLSSGLLGLWVLAGSLLPWTEAELDEVEHSLRALGYFLTNDQARLHISRSVHRR